VRLIVKIIFSIQIKKRMFYRLSVILVFFKCTLSEAAEIAYSVLQFAAGWTLWGSNPGGVRFAMPCRPTLTSIQPLVKWLPVLSGGKAVDCGADTSF
jgi:hypothetical protein